MNYATLMHVLWPFHHAWLIIWRLLVDVRFGELVSADERDRVGLVTRFFNAITKENSGRATRKQEPLSFDDAKKKWERIVSASFPRAAAKSAPMPQNGGRGQTGAARGAGPGRGGAQGDNDRGGRHEVFSAIGFRGKIINKQNSLWLEA